MIRRIVLISLAIIVLVLIVFGYSSDKLLDWLWYKSLGFTEVFWTPLLTGVITKTLLGTLFFIFLFINLLLTKRAFFELNPEVKISAKQHLSLSLIISVVLTLFLLPGLTYDWSLVQQFLHRASVGTVDPIFGIDLGFYMFVFPLLQKLNLLLLALLVLTLLSVTVAYLVAQAYWYQEKKFQLWPRARIHLTVLGVIFLLVKAWGYYLNRFEMLFEEKTLLTGVDFTAHHVRIAGYNLLMIIAVLSAVLLVWSIFNRRQSKLLIAGIGLWLIVSFLTGLVSQAVEAIYVRPNQFIMEEEYLSHHINFTRFGYELDKIRGRSYNPKPTGNISTLTSEHPSLTNLRIWDYRPLLPSYNQLQSIRSYYTFNDIDIDRYDTRFGQCQVMLAARELDPEKLPSAARNWLNLHLTYTHGYGLAMNLVNQTSGEGQPLFIAKNLPPRTDPDYPELIISRPEIYFGEINNDYILVNTKQKEFDYPLGDQNVTTTYHGKDGISLRRFATRLLFALKLREKNLILSGYITKDSRIIIHREIRNRVSRLAPFLRLDKDPYLVLADGRLYWMVDAYTLSRYLPYSKHHAGGFNYIRNSVKVVVDAYHGTVDLYVVDEEEPIIKTWQRIFPRLFKPLAQMPDALRKHTRYPEDLFSVQRDMLVTYHMTDPKTFYEKEDYWDLPTQIYNDNEEPMIPYYVTLRLPGEERGEFLLMQPYTPRGKRNMISWLVARCDEPNYGELIVYTLPKDTNIYGPMQIEARIGQNPEITQLITLWNQNQSRLIRGNLLVIPLEDSLLYAEPFYILSEQGQIPEFKKIVLAFGEKIVMGDNLTEALAKLKGEFKPAETTRVDMGTRVQEPSLSPPADRAEEPGLKEMPAADQKAIIKELKEKLLELEKLLEKLEKSA